DLRNPTIRPLRTNSCVSRSCYSDEDHLNFQNQFTKNGNLLTLSSRRVQGHLGHGGPRCCGSRAFGCLRAVRTSSSCPTGSSRIGLRAARVRISFVAEGPGMGVVQIDGARSLFPLDVVDPWFVLRTKSRQEKVLSDDLRSQGIPHF